MHNQTEHEARKQDDTSHDELRKELSDNREYISKLNRQNQELKEKNRELIAFQVINGNWHKTAEHTTAKVAKLQIDLAFQKESLDCRNGELREALDEVERLLTIIEELKSSSNQTLPYDHPDIVLINIALQHGEFGQRLIAQVGLNLVATLLKKNKDYGNTHAKQNPLTPNVTPQTAILSRLNDKYERLAQLLANPGSQQINESVLDTMTDLAGYAILYVVNAKSKTENKPTTEVPTPLPAYSEFRASRNPLTENQ